MIRVLTTNLGTSRTRLRQRFLIYFNQANFTDENATGRIRICQKKYKPQNPLSVLEGKYIFETLTKLRQSAWKKIFQLSYADAEYL